MVVAVDLFCGVGGLTKGLEDAGVFVKAGYDLDPACNYPYETNTRSRFFHQDVLALQASSLQSHLGKDSCRVIVGCAPCQTFSTYAMGKRSAAGADPRWDLVKKFVSLVVAVRPEVVSMENVPRLVKHEVFSEAVAALQAAGYHVWHKIVKCSDYGVPQKRQRLVLLASTFGRIELEKPKGEPMQTVRTTISHLPEVAHGVKNACDPLHYASKLSELNFQRVCASKPGGSWRDWDDSLRVECHKRPSGKTYRSVYGRMDWDDLAPTLTTLCLGVGNGRFTHPDQDRGLTIREAALLQTFPADYCFAKEGETIKPRVLSRLIGNAVPVRLAHAIGRTIVDHAANYRSA